MHTNHVPGRSEPARRAVVLGGGIAGLLAAAALATKYDEVVIVDRDRIPDDATPRRGIPQGRHAHALLAGGQLALEQLLPGITEELNHAGAATGDVLGDTLMRFSGHRFVRATSGLVAISASRPFLEAHIRRRIEHIDAVRLSARVDATGLLVDDGRITGVRLMRRIDDSAEELLEADLVVDALGTRSRVPTWLHAAGFDAPTEERRTCDARYATRLYSHRQGDLDGLLAIVEAPTRTRPRGAVLARVEHDTWMLTMSGMAGETPPSQPGDFTHYARSLGSPEIDTIVDRRTDDVPITHRFAASRRRRYDRLTQPPDGLIALGDSVATFNPVYGQGMAVAAKQAAALERQAHDGPIEPRRWFRTIDQILRPAWEMAGAADATLSDPRSMPIPRRIATRYITAIHATAAHDPDIAHAFVRVAGLVDPPTTLIRPRTIARIAQHQLTRNDMVPQPSTSSTETIVATSPPDTENGDRP